MARKVWYQKKDKAVGAVVGALLLASMGVTFFAAYTIWYIPTTTQTNQQHAFADQSGAFISMSQEINTFPIPGQKISQSVPLGIGGAPPFTQGTQTSLNYRNNTSAFSGTLSYSLDVTLKNTTNPASGGQNPVAELNITLANTQNVSEPSSYQQKLVIDSSSYSKYEAGNLQNIRFFYPNGTVIPSWLESGNTNTSTTTVYWLNLYSINGTTSTIATQEIVMKFFPKTTNMFNAFETGEAPQLSPIYAIFDDGPRVFPAYFNGDSGLRNFDNATGVTILQNTSTPYGTSTIHTISVTGYSTVKNGSFAGFAFKRSLPVAPVIVQSNFEALNSSEMGAAGLVNYSSGVLTGNAVSIDTGNGASYFAMEYINNGSQSTGLNSKGSVSNSWRYASLYYNNSTIPGFFGYIAPNINGVGGYNGTLTALPSLFNGSFYMGMVGKISKTAQWNERINWMRAMMQPSYGVMPVSTFAPLYIIPPHPFILTYSGTFSFSGSLESDLNSGGLSNTYLYLADGATINYQNGISNFLYGVPFNVSGNTGHTSFNTKAISMSLGQSVAPNIVDYGSTIVSIVATNVQSVNYTTGENLTLLTGGLEPFTSVVKYINLTSFSYTVNGFSSSAMNNSLHRSYDPNGAVKAGKWNFTVESSIMNAFFSNPSFTISLANTNVLSLQSVSVYISNMEVISI